ncbi:MAG: hypothetical protein NTX72_01160 [Candidatus Uhrbacteria bacterium]|nr:hypothetical protein [Candidatus Uhrbacteria bacterium]
MRTFRLKWKKGDAETVTGLFLSDALSNAGYGRGATDELETYQQVIYLAVFDPNSRITQIEEFSEGADKKMNFEVIVGATRVGRSVQLTFDNGTVKRINVGEHGQLISGNGSGDCVCAAFDLYREAEEWEEEQMAE